MKSTKLLMPYKELIKSFKEGRELLYKLQGPITDKMIEDLEDSRKYLKGKRKTDK